MGGVYLVIDQSKWSIPEGCVIKDVCVFTVIAGINLKWVGINSCCWSVCRLQCWSTRCEESQSGWRDGV